MNDKTVGQSPATSDTFAPSPPFSLDLAPELHGVYSRWVKAPGDMLGFWFAPDAADARDRAGAISYSIHNTLRIGMRGPRGDQPVALHDFRRPSEWARMGFIADRPVSGVRIHVSSAFDGAGGRVRLARIDRDATESTLADVGQTDARREAWLTVSPGYATPFGHYVVEVRADRKRVEVWPGAATRPTTWIENPVGDDDRDGDAAPARQPGLAFLATVLYADGTTESLRSDDRMAEYSSVGDFDPTVAGAELGMTFGIGLGEHNNPFFVRYDDAFVRAHPSAFMADATGAMIFTGDRGAPVPAVDDALLTRLADEQIRAGVAYYGRLPQLRYWVIAGEESYPDYFGLAPGDFRVDSLRHYNAYRAARKYSEPPIPVSGFEPRSPGHDRWMEFREAAMNERAAHYMQTFLYEDSSRPILYPTHGNPFFSFGRGALGHDAGGIALACDGFETGQITLDDDTEELNLLTLAHLTAFGKPVVTPRLANKTLDRAATGGGRTFTPAMLRRLVMECLGMGVGHIGLVQWIGNLPDGEWQIRGAPAEAEARRVFAQLTQAAPYLAGMSRLQPRVALFVSDAAWRREGWNPRWTGFFQDALDRQWQTTIVGDALLDAALPARIPVLVCLDTPTVSRATLRRLLEYLDAGGSVFVWGDFARRDEYGKDYPADNSDRVALANHSRRIRMDFPPANHPRALVNRSSTPFGAHVESRDFTPVPFDEIERRVAAVLPLGAIRPIDVVSPGDRICCLTLTDGATLIAVLINRAAVPVEVSIRANVPGNETGSGKGDWFYRQVGTDDAARRAPSKGEWKSTLPPNGTALVWLVRDARESPAWDRANAYPRAQGAMQTFARLGCDVAHLQACATMADEANAAAIPEKRDALAARIVDSLGVRMESRETESGDLLLSTGVYDSAGNAVVGAIATANFVPGDGEAVPLRETTPGNYETTIFFEDRPLIYDVERGAYARLTGAARVEIRARSGRREGGAMTTIVLGAPKGNPQ